MSPRIVCIGGGGHAVVVIDTLQEIARTSDLSVTGFLAPVDADGQVLGVSRLGDDADLPRLVSELGLTHFIVAVGSTRGGTTRRRLFDSAFAAGLAPFAAVHPAATVATSVRLGDGSIVMAGAIVQPRGTIGRNAILNTRSSIDHDCHIGDNVHVAPGAVLCGGVVLEDEVHVGAGAVVLQNVRIGRGATIAAGATVVRDVEAGAVVKGTPAVSS